MMRPVIACDTPMKCTPPKMPKRLARLRRNIESKRIDNFKKIQESIKTAAREEREAVRDFWRGIFDNEDVPETKDGESSSSGEDSDE